MIFAGTLTLTGTHTLHNVTFNGGGSTYTLASGTRLTVGATLSFTDGSIDTGTVAARGDLSQASTFDGGTGLLVVDGPGDQVFTSTGTTVIRTPVRTPVANAYAERWIGSVRRELLDRTLIWNRHQLEGLLREFVEHYNTHRPHRSLGHRAPDHREVVAYRPGQPIRRRPTCGGLINQYHHAA